MAEKGKCGGTTAGGEPCDLTAMSVGGRCYHHSEAPICAARTKTGNRCTRKAAYGSLMCGQHKGGRVHVSLEERPRVADKGILARLGVVKDGFYRDGSRIHMELMANVALSQHEYMQSEGVPHQAVKHIETRLADAGVVNAFEVAESICDGLADTLFLDQLEKCTGTTWTVDMMRPEWEYERSGAANV